jgi:UPF0755 protein
VTRFLAPREIAALVLVVVAIIGASYFIARTPGSVIDDPVLGEREAAGPREAVDYTSRRAHRLPRSAPTSSDWASFAPAGSSVPVALMGLEDQLSAGDHRLKTNSSVADVINLITLKPGVATLRVTFPEGIRIEEMAARAEEAGFGSADEFLAAVAAAQVPASLRGVIPEGQDYGRFEGYLFPDTYIFPVGSTAEDLVALMLETFDTRLSPELRAAIQAEGLTIHQGVTLASIVEREAVKEDERALIAGVFLNRIAAVDVLGADPTVQFALTVGHHRTRVRLVKRSSPPDPDRLPVQHTEGRRYLRGITNPGLALSGGRLSCPDRLLLLRGERADSRRFPRLCRDARRVPPKQASGADR